MISVHWTASKHDNFSCQLERRSTSNRALLFEISSCTFTYDQFKLGGLSFQSLDCSNLDNLCRQFKFSNAQLLPLLLSTIFSQGWHDIYYVQWFLTSELTPYPFFAPRRFFRGSLSVTAFCARLFFVTAFVEIKPYGNLHLVQALGSGEQSKGTFTQ